MGEEEKFCESVATTDTCDERKINNYSKQKDLKVYIF